jgi:mannosyltransferase OCH1-like enzyme
MQTESIPKVIHYFWFGRGTKNDLIKRCITSWGKTCPDFTIKEWTEETYDVNAHPFSKKMYTENRFAFVADYARLEVLEKEGGFYLDTDMLLLQSLSPFIDNACVLGEEESGIISAGMIGAVPHHDYIKKARNYYDKNDGTIITIPRALTKVFNELESKEGIKICPPHYFYPFDQKSIKEYRNQKLPDDVYGVHLWNYSWGHPLNKFFKKIGIYSVGKKTTEILGVKKIIKKLLKFI